MNYYEEIKNELIDNEVYEKIKDYSKEMHKVKTNFELGKLLYEAGKHYGEDIIGSYSHKLIWEVNKKYNGRTLRRYRQFYLMFSDEKWSTLLTKLSWSHYIQLLPLKEENELLYYFDISIKQNLDVRSLNRKIKSNEYERLDESTKLKLINEEKLEVKDLIPNPIVINNKNNYEEITEKILQKLILEDIENFMKELGNNFCFIGSEYKIKIEDRYNYIDLLLFNYEYNCFIVIELKITELKKEHIGQIQVYMNYIDSNLRKISHDKTIGIIICKKNNKYIIEYCSDKRIIAKEYKFIN